MVYLMQVLLHSLEIMVVLQLHGVLILHSFVSSIHLSQQARFRQVQFKEVCSVHGAKAMKFCQDVPPSVLGQDPARHAKVAPLVHSGAIARQVKGFQGAVVLSSLHVPIW